MGGKSKTTSNSTQTTTPYGAVTPVINQGSGIMSDYLNNPNSTAVYGGPRVADLSTDTQAGLQGLRDSTGANASQDYLMSVLNNPANIADNPQVQAMQDAIRRQVQASSNSNFSNSGTVGGTAHQGSFAKGMADGLAQPLFQAWQTDQANKLNAAGQLPGVGQQIINNQMGAGQVVDSHNQANINADMQKFEENRTAPLKAWNEVAPIATQIGSQFGTTKGKTTTSQSTPIGSQILGGALAGAGMLSGMPGLSSMFGGLMGSQAPNPALQPWTYSLSR